MPATLETVITRPSLDDVFFFEFITDIDWVSGISYLKLSDYKEDMGVGWISTELEIPITWEEIENRRSELRPDLIEMLKYKRPLAPIAEYSFMWWIGANGEPPFNPFSLTYSFKHFYETYDNLISAYNSTLKNKILNFEPFILQTNNIGTERCFVDNREVEFRGAFAEIAEKQKAP